MVNEIADNITFDTRDEFARIGIAKKITSLLASDARVSPMIIDGGWGTGKTEFCKKLINHIKCSDLNFEVVYIDAFRYDNNSEPLLAVLSSIIKILPEDEQTSLIEKALPAIKFGIKTTLKAGVSWVLKQDAADIADDFDGELKKVGDAAANHAVEAVLKDHVASEENIELLINTLVEVTNAKPIIIVIDELDRCRPDYSVTILEYIKHIFNVPNIQFILVTNKEQLRASIIHTYGAIDAQKYLDKFISYSFILPQVINSQAHNERLVSVIHLQGLLEASQVLADSKLTEEGVFYLLETLVKTNNLSLREVETLVRYMEIYHIVTESDGFKANLIFGHMLLRVVGIYIFCFHSEQAELLSGGVIDCSFLSRIVGKPSLIDLDDDRPDLNDILVAIFSSESKVASDKFEVLYENKKPAWEENIRSLFQGSRAWAPERGERMEIVTKTINALKLSDSN